MNMNQMKTVPPHTRGDEPGYAMNNLTYTIITSIAVGVPLGIGSALTEMGKPKLGFAILFSAVGAAYMAGIYYGAIILW
jgi:hypothetical protein